MKLWQILAVLAAIVFITGFFSSPSYAGAPSGDSSISITTNDPDSVRTFFADLGFEWWPGPGPKGIAYYQAGCWPGTIFLGIASDPPPRPAVPAGLIACISSQPEKPDDRQSWCDYVQLWREKPYIVSKVSADGFTITCDLPWDAIKSAA